MANTTRKRGEERTERGKAGPHRQFDDRPARKQADRMENDGVEHSEHFNIWYGPRKRRRGNERAPARCDSDSDAGNTRGSEAGVREFCIFFARGTCARGYDCHKLHFLPTDADDAAEDNTHDCFGRERSSEDSSNGYDRDGPGSFLRENRTLWAGGVPAFDEASARERVRRNFGEWGRITSVRVIKNKSCAFIQYACRANAEFAKEAMGNQTLLTLEQMASRAKLADEAAASGRLRRSLAGPSRPPSSGSSAKEPGGVSAGDEGPVLHVRWAAEDPNPRAVMRIRQQHAQTLLAAQVARGGLPRDVTGKLPGADRALLRKAGLDPYNPSQVDLEWQNTQRQFLAVAGYGSPTDAHNSTADARYPNTDHQYPNTDQQYPNTDDQYPNANDQYSGNDHRYSGTDYTYPSADHQYPSTDHQCPNIDHQYPSTDHQYPNMGQHFSTGSYISQIDRSHPTADHKSSANGDIQHSGQSARQTNPAERVIVSARSPVPRSGVSDGTASSSQPGNGFRQTVGNVGCIKSHLRDGGADDYDGNQTSVESAIGSDACPERRRQEEDDKHSCGTKGEGVEAASDALGTTAVGSSLSLLGGYGSDDSD